MAARGPGFDVRIEALEAAAHFAATQRGDYEAAIAPWSGRADPDGNVSIWMQCDGFINWGKYCNAELDGLLATRARRHRRRAPPAAALPRVPPRLYLRDRPQELFLYHLKWLWAASERVEGFSPVPDGLVRPQGIRVRP